MFSATTYTIRLATPIDQPALLWLADIDSQGPLRPARCCSARSTASPRPQYRWLTDA